MIIFINGSINSGKSTVAKILATKISNTAIVEIDSFHSMIEWMPIEQAVPINLENAISTIKNFVNKSLNIIVPYPLSQKNYDYMLENLKGLNTKISVFTLAPKLEKVLVNRGTRDLNDWEIDRINHHYKIGIHTPSFGEIIDNSEQTPKQTADIILNKIS